MSFQASRARRLGGFLDALDRLDGRMLPPCCHGTLAVRADTVPFSARGADQAQRRGRDAGRFVHGPARVQPGAEVAPGWRAGQEALEVVVLVVVEVLVVVVWVPDPAPWPRSLAAATTHWL
jgi:hypothetical protein